MKYLVYDIETIPRSELSDEWKRTEDFPPHAYHKIVTIGALLLDENYNFVKAGCLGRGEQSEGPLIEKDVVLAFTTQARDKAIIDFNGRGFDMPVIQLRALAHGLQLPFYFEKKPDQYGKVSTWSKGFRDRYAGHHIDLCDLWSNYGASPRQSLATLSKLCGLPGKLDVDGTKVETLYDDGLHSTIDRYCMEDVYQTAMLFLRWLYLKGDLDWKETRERLQLILNHMGELDEHVAFLAKVDKERLLLK